MREAIGTTFMYYLIIPIFVFLIFFVTFVMKYASAYRANNYVATLYEQYEGKPSNCTVCDALSNYYYEGNPTVTCTNLQNYGSVYSVSTKVSFDIPLLDVKVGPTIKTETKTVYGVSCPKGGITINCKSCKVK